VFYYEFQPLVSWKGLTDIIKILFRLAGVPFYSLTGQLQNTNQYISVDNYCHSDEWKQ
jgi:hypothetical protein